MKRGFPRAIALGVAALASWWMLAIATAALAQTDPGTQARELGARGNTAAAAAPLAEPATYPGFSGSSPPETRYFHSGAAIEDEARAVAPSTSVGTVVDSRSRDGARFRFGASDPILVHGRDAASAGTSILANNYAGCQAMHVDAPGSTGIDATCHASGGNPVATCSEALTASCPSADACTSPDLPIEIVQSNVVVNFQPPVLTLGEIRGRGDCKVVDAEIQFTVPNEAALRELRLSEADYDDWMLVTFNDESLFMGPKNGDRLEIDRHRVVYDAAGDSGACEVHGERTEPLSVDLRQRLQPGINRLHVRLAGGGSFFNGTLKIAASQFCDCKAGDRWSRACVGDVGRPSCRRVSRTCPGGRLTRNVDGIPVTRECWAWSEEWLCEDASQREDPACTALRGRGCRQTASTCEATGSDGHCSRWRQSFSCGQGAAQKDVTLCGSDLYCAHGDCMADLQARTPATPAAMAQAATWLQQAQNVGHDLDDRSGKIAFFRGDAQKCKDEAFGFSNCCSDAGWGQDAGLAQCSAEENALGLAKQAKRAHFVGHYSTGSLVRTKHKSYCTFTSMLSRLIQEQGRVQLGMDWGRPKSPDCRALSPEEMASLDFNRMDFSEFYGQAQATAVAAMVQRPSNAAIQQEVQAQVEQAETPAGGGGENPAP